MFVYGVCAGPSGKFERLARPAIVQVSPTARIIVRKGQRSIHKAYNSIIREARKLTELEGLILLHDDTVIEDERLEAKLRDLFADPKVGIVGVIGGRSHSTTMRWWKGERRGAIRDNQQGQLDFGRGTHRVDTVDGLLLALSPAATRVLHCDTHRYDGFHGYDAELCAQARHVGLKVIVADIDVYHDNNAEAWFGDELSFMIADLTYRLKWEPMSPFVRRRRTARRLRLKWHRLRRDTRAWRR